MTMFKKWLQFFADGGSAADGGEGSDAGAETGVTPGDPGQALEALGVPKRLAERHAKRVKTVTTAAPAPAAQQSEGAPVAEQAAPMSWDDFMKIPENNAKMQQMMSDRLKRQGKENDEYMSKLNPALELIAAKYGIKAVDGRFDPEQLAAAVQGDDSYYEDRAIELGVDIDTAKHIAQLEQEKARNDAAKQAELKAQQEQQREFELRQHFMKMQQQANVLKETFPDFDLQRELQNPEFLKRTSPDVGMSVEDAFYSIHHGQVMEKQAAVIAQKTKADLANSIRAGKNHPRENGGIAAAASVGVPDFSQMTHAERLAYIKRTKPPR